MDHFDKQNDYHKSFCLLYIFRNEFVDVPCGNKIIFVLTFLVAFIAISVEFCKWV